MPALTDKRFIVPFLIVTALLFAAMVNVEVRSFYDTVETTHTVYSNNPEQFDKLERAYHVEEFDEYYMGYEITVSLNESGGYDLYAFEINAFAHPKNDEREWARTYFSLSAFHIEGALESDRHFLLDYEEPDLERKERTLDVSLHPMHILGYENIAESSASQTYSNEETSREDGLYRGTFEFYDAHAQQGATTYYIVAVPEGEPFEHTVRICAVFEQNRSLFGPLNRTSNDRVRLLYDFAHNPISE